jgi:anti-sigma factor RsiW
MDDDACRQLDAYLDMELPSDATRAFVAHLAMCAACRDAVDEQRWIDELLRSDEAAAIETAPKIVALPTVRTRRRRLALAAAAVVIAATAVLLFPLPGREGLGEGRPTNAQAPTPDRSPSSNHVATRQGSSSAAFVSAGSSIAVPVASDDPHVTIVQLYPTVTALRRWQREAELRGHVFPPNGG